MYAAITKHAYEREKISNTSSFKLDSAIHSQREFPAKPITVGDES